MAHEALTVDIKSEHGGDAMVYCLRGSLDIATAPSMRAALVEAAEEGKHDIIVDLRQVEFLDSTGLGALVGGHKRASENGGCVRLIVGEGIIRRLLTITGLMQVFPVYETTEAALEDRDRIIATL